MSVEGRLKIGLTRAGSSVLNVEISSSRPLQTPEIFIGKSVDRLLDIVPLLYSVCGTAQACAAVSACEQALGELPSARVQAAREMLVWMETAKEHLWRILLDWPTLMERTPDSDGVAQMMGILKQFRASLFQDCEPFKLGKATLTEQWAPVESCIQDLEAMLSLRLFNMPLKDWLSITNDKALEAWIDRSPTSTGAMMEWVKAEEWASVGAVEDMPLPELPNSFYQAHLSNGQANEFIAAPDWDGKPCETSAYTRVMDRPLFRSVVKRWGNGLMVRYVSRLIELAEIPERLREGIRYIQRSEEPGLVGTPQNLGQGIAQVEAARGRLVHRVELEGQTVKCYQILAPTEWNFHPQGVLAKGLSGLIAEQEDVLKQKAIFLINAIDPCVGYDLAIAS